MSFRKTFLVALTTLFVIPLAIFMGQSIELGGTLSAWAGLLLGSIYGGCALGVCWMLLGYWERHLLGAQKGHREDTRLHSGDHLEPMAEVPAERDLMQALDPTDPAEDLWQRESQGRMLDQAHTLADARTLLRGCIEKAEGLPSLGAESDRFRALTLENYAIDMRRLFDALTHESDSAVIVLYSREDRNLLFATDVAQNLFGWEPERFVERFSELVIGARLTWEEMIESLEPHQEASLRIVLQTKARDHVPVDSVWGVIRAGSFQGMVVGILSSVEFA